MARLPESRVRAPLSESASRPFVDHSIEGLKTEVEVIFPSVSRKCSTIKSMTKEPLVGARPTEWGKHEGDCLHCGDALGEGCVPIAKYKTDGKFWVFGQFCCGGCSLGYIREQSMGAQVQTWTSRMLIDVFSCKFPIPFAPPRCMLSRYGGPISSKEWKTTHCTSVKSPPLCTFAMFAECTSKKSEQAQSGLSRPKERDTMPAVRTTTGKEPVILKVLAKDQDEDSGKRKKKQKTTALESFFR